MVIQVCNPRTQEAEAGGLQVPDQPGLDSENLSQRWGRKATILELKSIICF
jgi:hypothetical protein